MSFLAKHTFEKKTAKTEKTAKDLHRLAYNNAIKSKANQKIIYLTKLEQEANEHIAELTAEYEIAIEIERKAIRICLATYFKTDRIDSYFNDDDESIAKNKLEVRLNVALMEAEQIAAGKLKVAARLAALA